MDELTDDEREVMRRGAKVLLDAAGEAEPMRFLRHHEVVTWQRRLSKCCFCGADNHDGAVGYAGERVCPSCGKGGHGEPDEPLMAYKQRLPAAQQFRGGPLVV